MLVKYVDDCNLTTSLIAKGNKCKKVVEGEKEVGERPEDEPELGN